MSTNAVCMREYVDWTAVDINFQLAMAEKTDRENVLLDSVKTDVADFHAPTRLRRPQCCVCVSQLECCHD